jgi:hypothetical protein
VAVAHLERRAATVLVDREQRLSMPRIKREVSEADLRGHALTLDSPPTPSSTSSPNSASVRT